MNLALEKGERVTMGGKGSGEIGGEAGEVTGVVADAPTTDGLGKSNACRKCSFSGKNVDMTTERYNTDAIVWRTQLVHVCRLM